MTGFVFGLVSIVLYEIGAIPLLAVTISAIGLGTYQADEQSGRWMAIVGLILGAIYTFAYLLAYGYIGT